MNPQEDQTLQITPDATPFQSTNQTGYDDAELLPAEDDSKQANQERATNEEDVEDVDVSILPDGVNGYDNKELIPDEVESKPDHEKKPISEFGCEGTAEGEFKIAKSLAISSDGNIAVAEHRLERVYLFDEEGIHKSTMRFDNTKKETKLLYPTDVAFTSPQHLAVVDQTRFVKIFDKEGAFLYSFTIKGGTDRQEERPKAYSIEVASDGQILVGDVRRKVITIHKELDSTWEWIGKVVLDIEPHFLAIGDFQNGHQNYQQNGGHHVLVCDWKSGLVKAVDLAAAEDSAIIFQIDSFTVDGYHGLPKGVAFDNDNQRFFLAVSRLDDSTNKKNVYINTGHIHEYSNSGQFQRCICKGLNHPRGMRWHKGTLYIANTYSVVILRVE